MLTYLPQLQKLDDTGMLIVAKIFEIFSKNVFFSTTAAVSDEEKESAVGLSTVQNPIKSDNVRKIFKSLSSKFFSSNHLK